MKKMILAFGTALCLSAVCPPQHAQAQTAEIENLDVTTTGSLLPIKNGGSVSGYAFIVKLDEDKSGKKMRLKILDENLKEIGSTDFEVEKTALIKQAFYESGAVMLVMEEPLSTKESKEYVKTFQLESKAVATVTYEPDEDEKKSGMFGKAIAQNNVPVGGRFKTVEGTGLLCTYNSTNKLGGLTAQMVGTDGKRKWKRKITGNEDRRMEVQLLTTTPKTVLFFASSRANVMDRDSKNFLIGLDAKTGQQLFRKPLEIGKEAWEPVFFKTLSGDDENTITVCSLLSDAEDKFYKASNTGFNYAKLNLTTGALSDVKTVNYADHLSQVMAMKTESKSEEGYLHIEDLILMPDGNMVIVGEFFKNTVSAAGVARTLLSGGGDMGYLEQGSIGDLFALRLSPEGAVQNLDKVEKDIRRCQAYTGVSSGLLGRYMASNGSFGYRYTDELADNRKTVIVEGNLKSGERGVNAITFTPGKGYKIKNLAPTAGGRESYAVLQGKPGHVLVIKTDTKAKKSSLSYQRLD